MSGTPVRRLPRAVREQQMLEAAVVVFAKRGFTGASMDEIADVAGISKPMVYAYLGTKEELFIACLQREAAGLIDHVVAALPAGAAPDEQLWAGLRAFFDFVGAHRDGWVVLYRQSRGQPPFAGEAAAMRERIVTVVADLLGRAALVSGLATREAELTASAYALVGAAESLADWLADHPEADPRQTAARMMNFAWLGARDLLDGETWTRGTPPPTLA